MLLRTLIAVQLAEQGISILLCPVGEMSDEAFDPLARGFAHSFRATEIDGVSFHQLRVESVLANNLTQTVANARAITISIASMAIAAVRGFRWKFAYRTLGRG